MNKWITYCQFAFRARQVSFGSMLIPSIQKKEAKVVIYSNRIGNNSKKKILDKCNSYGVPVFETDQMDLISSGSIVAFGILDRSLANQVLEVRKGMVKTDGLQQTSTKEETKS